MHTEGHSPQSTSRLRLAGRVALVTGAGRNVGRGIAIACAHEGASVAVADIDRGSAEAVAAELREHGHSAFAAVGDGSDFAEIDRMFAQTENELGTVDLLINNAYVRTGDSNWRSFLTVEPEDWSLFVEKNMSMLFGCTQRAARALAAEGRPGAIVNISSHGAERAHRNHIAYDSVKGAMDSFTRAVAVDLAPWGIRVNGIRPGAISVLDEPPAWDGKADVRIAQIPLGRTGTPADVATAVVFLASEDAAYMTGQTITVDGGLLAQGRAPQVDSGTVYTPDNIGEFSRQLLP